MIKSFLKGVLAVILFLSLFQNVSMASISQEEHQALMDLYNSTQGVNWVHNENWGGELVTENSWYGVVTDPDNTMVLELNLFQNRLQGSLPSTLSNLTNLTKLDLSYNWYGLTGEIPDLSKIKNLQYLDLSVNLGFNSGPLPQWLKNLTKLQVLNFFQTNRNGTIPAELTTLQNLLVLNIGWNEFSGEIPDFSSLKNLQYLNLEKSVYLTRTGIPEWIFKMYGLKYLNLNRTGIIGNIPQMLNKLTNLESLNLGFNNFSGDIPDLSSLVNLTELNLSGNFNLNSGLIPMWIFNLGKLKFLSFEETNRVGAIPSEIGNLVSLERLYLDSNWITFVPPEIGNLKNLKELWLNGNNIEILPDEIGNCINLTDLALGGNQIEVIPETIGNLTNLKSLGLSFNNLYSIPEEMGNLKNLNGLYLDHNEISTFPDELCDLNNLEILYLDNNEIVSIPTKIGNMTRLNTLSFSNNQISTIPSEMGNLINLLQIDIYGNKIKSIPIEMCNLTNLWSLDLSDNQITSIPPEIGNLTNLFSLGLDNNKITSLPPEIGNLTNLFALYLQGNAILQEIPSTFLKLKDLNNHDGLDLRWNALYSLDSQLIDFLNQKQCGSEDFRNTQTLPPEGVAAFDLNSNSVKVSFTPVSYQSDEGFYEIYSSATSGGEYTLKCKTTSKSSNSAIVEGLCSGTTYYFVVRTVTNPHQNNKNVVESKFSNEAFATTTGPKIDLSPETLPDGFINNAYQSAVSASGGTLPYLFEISEGVLPAGLLINNNDGRIGGIPTALGNFSFTVKATDSNGFFGEKKYTISIKVIPPVIEKVGKLQNPFRLKIEGSNFHPDCVVKVNGTEVPHTSYKNSTKIIAEKGLALKALLPKGVAVQITVENSDDGGISSPITFMR